MKSVYHSIWKISPSLGYHCRRLKLWKFCLLLLCPVLFVFRSPFSFVSDSKGTARNGLMLSLIVLARGREALDIIILWEKSQNLFYICAPRRSRRQGFCLSKRGCYNINKNILSGWKKITQQKRNKNGKWKKQQAYNAGTK